VRAGVRGRTARGGVPAADRLIARRIAGLASYESRRATGGGVIYDAASET
jgi:hypothetical protein